MNTDLDKLAAELQDMKPTKASKDTGMNAAMAAFDSVFADAPETVSEPATDINSESSQGLDAEPRHTSQTVRTTRVETKRSGPMAAFNSIFNMSPKTAMMGSGCVAALLAALVIMPANPIKDMPPVQVQPIEVVEPLPLPTPPVSAPKAAEPTAPEVRVAPLVPKTQDVQDMQDMDVAEATPPTEAEARAATADVQVKSGITSVGALQDKVQISPAVPAPKVDLNRSVSVPVIERQNSKLSQGLSGRKRIAPISPVQTPPAYALQGQLPQTSAMPSGAAPQLPGGLTLEEVPAEFDTVTETIVIQEASTELITVPAEYETVTETVVVTPQSVEYEAIPGEYGWVDGEIEGSAVEYETQPAQYETYQETVVVQEASTELVTIPPTYETVMETVVVTPEYQAPDGSTVPAVTKQQARRVVKTPASTQERIIPPVTKMETRRRIKTPASTVERVVPNIIKDGKTRIQIKPPQTREKIVPPVTKEVTRRVIKTPAQTRERVKSAEPQQVTRQVIVTPPKFYLRDEDGRVIREFESRDQFERYQANLPKSVTETPVSTFSVDVDTASYSFVRSALNSGQLPPPGAVRIEEMINYFPYDYTAPRSADTPFKANVTVTETPWNSDTKLMHIGVQGYTPPVKERPDSNIVFLIDTSGSMSAANKLPLLISSFNMMLKTLDEDDTVSIVTYAGSAGTVLEPTPASDKEKIYAALNNLRAGGSTAGAAGLELAYIKAKESFKKDGSNRVILATDGDFNVGFSSHAEMKTFIEKKRKTGVFLSVLGFGNGNYNDQLMQALAQNGNGVAAYIDTLSEANKVLGDAAGGALLTIAKDVKIQVEFNPATIAEYRLIGYETRALKRQDFNNDKVDAGDIGAGHSVTAVYEITPVGSPAVTIDKLRYVSEDAPKTTGSDEYAFVKIRHKLADADTSTLQTFPVGKGQERRFSRASDDTRFAAAVAAFGQKLRGDSQVADYSYDDIIDEANSAKGEDKFGYRAEFIKLVRLAEGLSD